MTVHVSRGRYYEEMVTGDVFKHEPGRTITESDNVLFSSLTLNLQSLHLDAAKSAGSEFGQRIVNSMMTLAVVCSVGGPDVTQGTAIANLGFGEIAFPAPVFIGDTLYSETEIGEKRLSASRSGQGLVVLEHRGFNQHGALVVRASRTALVRCLPEGEPARA